jgi:hypothetical protein
MRKHIGAAAQGGVIGVNGDGVDTVIMGAEDIITIMA